MSRRTKSHGRRPVLEALEGRNLLSSAIASRVAEPFIRTIPAEVSAPSSRATIGYSTVLSQLGGTPVGTPGQVVTVNVGLAFVDRTGLRLALTGRRVDLYVGSSLIGSSSTNRMVINGRDSFGQASFSFRIPSNASHGTVIRLQFKYAGEQIYGPSTGSGQVNVR
jgi:hypothetical protein